MNFVNKLPRIKMKKTNKEKFTDELIRANKELSDYKYALDKSSIVSITDPEGNIKSVNENFVGISKFSREELIGKNHSIVNSGYHPKKLFSEMWQTITAGKVWRNDVKSKAKDGTYYWADTTIVPFMNEQGKPYQYVAIRNDITERKAADELIKKNELFLKETEYFFEESQMAASIGSYKTDFIKGFWKSSAVLDQIFGIDLNYNRTIDGWLDLVFLEDKEVINQHLTEDVILKRLPFNKEYRIVRKADGEIRWVHGFGKVDFDSNGNILSMVGTIQDITERRQTENKLYESEYRYRLLAENVNDVIWVVDPATGRFLFISPSVEPVLGYTPDEMMKMYFSDTLLPEFRAPFLQAMQARIESFNTNPQFTNRYLHEAVHVHKNGTILNAEIANHYYLNKNTGRLEIQGVSRDITARKKSEKLLNESEQRYRLLAENVKDIIWVLDPGTGHFTYISPSVESGLGYSPIEMKEMHFSETLHPECREPFLRNVKERIENFYKNPELISEYLHEVVHLHKNGRLIYAEISNHYYLNKITGLLEIQGVSRDITERKKSEIALQKSQKDFRTFIDNSMLAICFFDADTQKILYSNSAFLQLLGYLPEEINSLVIYDFMMHPKEAIKATLASLIKSEPIDIGERVWKRKDGSLVNMFISASGESRDNANIIFVSGQNITNLKKSEIEKGELINELRHKNLELHQLSSHLQNIREKERTHIAREIHDELGQMLTVQKMDIGWIRQKQNNTDKEVVSKLSEMLEFSDNIINTVRKISTELRPAIIDDLGLIAALEWKCGNFQDQTGIPCKFISYNEEEKFDANFSINVFRILQEILTNITRHAKAESVVVSIIQNEKELIMQITDDGIGIDSEAINKNKTLGITGMKERARLLNGELIINGKKNKGTQIELIIPFKYEHTIS